jgi:hypothetical protein
MATGLAGDPHARLFWAWIALCLALALHVIDEASTGFLGVYNPSVRALRQRWPWLPLPVFTFGIWLAGLVLAVVLLLYLSVFVLRGAGWIRPLGYVFAFVMLANGLGHIVGTILGRTVGDIRFRGQCLDFIHLLFCCWRPCTYSTNCDARGPRCRFSAAQPQPRFQIQEDSIAGLLLLGVRWKVGMA